MSPRPVTWRRLGVSAVALATAAAGLPVLLSTSASAAPASRLIITQDDTRTTAAAGTCTAFTVNATDPFGNQSDAATITVTIAESPESNTHDVDFCLVEQGTDFAAAPRYTNEPTTEPTTDDPLLSGLTQEYDAGPSITSTPADSPTPPPGKVRASNDNPDDADDANNNLGGIQRDGANNINPSGIDRTSFRSLDGVVRFGVVGLQSGAAATIDAFVDNGRQFSRDNNSDGDTTDAGDDNVVAQQRRVTFTQGGLPGSLAVNDAVRRVELKPEDSLAAKPSAGGAATHSFTLQAFNVSGDVLGGVNQARLVATAGPNAPASTTTTNGNGTGSCSPTGNEGQPASCTYSASTAGTDTVTGFVNQTTGSPTPGLDANEPQDTSTATTTPPANTNPAAARTLVLTPSDATIPAGQARDFTAAVTDASGAPVNGVSIRFEENGPGVFQEPATTGAVTSTAVRDTSGAGRATVRFLTSTTDRGSNVITATINRSDTQCSQQASGSTTAGNCSDTSPVTITAPASPTPAGSPSPAASGTPTPRPTTSGTPSATPTGTATAQPAPGSRYRGLPSPVRVLDTRDSRGARRSGEIVLDLSGRLNDAEATAAVLNVTVTNPTARGFLVAYPNGNPKPGTSNVNFEINQTQANEVVVGLPSSKRVSLFVDSAQAHVVVDLVGSFTRDSGADTGRVVTSAPVRAFDSRTTTTERRRGEVVLDLTSRLPDGATDAILNVTVQGPDARGFVVVYPTGTGKPGTSNVNFERGQTQANEVVTRVGTGQNAGRVSLFIDSASSALIVDVVGAVVSGSAGTPQTYTALQQPTRALDTRNNNGIRRTGEVTVSMPSSVPAGATGVVLNVTATNGTGPGFVAVYPAGTANPGTSNVNFPTNLTQANEVTSRLGNNRSVTLFVGGRGTPQAHLIVDVVGYLTNP